MVIYENGYLIAKKLAAAAENRVTTFPSSEMDFDYDFDLWTSVNMQLDVEDVVGVDCLNRALSYVFYFIQCGLAWRGEDLYIPIIRTPMAHSH